MSTPEPALPTTPDLCRSLCADLLVTDACPDCGHIAAMHIGVEHCAVCELVLHNRQARAAIGQLGVHVEVTGLDERTLAHVVQRVLERDRRTQRTGPLLGRR